MERRQILHETVNNLRLIARGQVAAPGSWIMAFVGDAARVVPVVSVSFTVRIDESNQ